MELTNSTLRAGSDSNSPQRKRPPAGQIRIQDTLVCTAPGLVRIVNGLDGPNGIDVLGGKIMLSGTGKDELLVPGVWLETRTNRVSVRNVGKRCHQSRGGVHLHPDFLVPGPQALGMVKPTLFHGVDRKDHAPQMVGRATSRERIALARSVSKTDLVEAQEMGLELRDGNDRR